VDSLSLAEVNTRLAQVRSTTFLTDSLKVTPVKYDAEKELWKMSVQHLQYKRENIQFDINIPRDKARSLSEAWDRVIIKGQLAFDFNDDVGLIRVIIINPDTKEVFAHNLETYKRLWDAAVIPNSKWFAVSPNAKYLLSEGTQNLNDYLAVRDLGSLNILGSQGIGFTFRNATISADNKFLAVSRSNDYSALEIYSLPSAKEYLTLKGSSMNAVVFSPDSRFIIYGTAEYVNQTGGYRKLVMITDIYSKVSTELYNPEDYVSSLALSPDAKHLIIGLDDRVGYSELLIMELKSLEIVKRYKLSGVTGIYFSPDGTKMGLTYKELFGSSYARIIDLVTYETVGTIPVGIYHKFAFSPDSKYAVTIQNRVLIYDIQTEKLVYASTSSPSFNETRFYPNKRYVLLGPWID
ncbi:MAG TPA: hypothetical protein PKI59_07990, partial [Candidatus Cloacimonadota bacterium]|nr:hypothetical protein [Candidatus Cloacimonadota bacterium]